jgi:hypothetical protein
MEGRKTLSVARQGIDGVGVVLCGDRCGLGGIGGRTRRFRTTVCCARTACSRPEELPSQPVALVVTLHGGEMDAFSANNHYDTKWMELAVLNNFIVVFPEGRPDPSGDGGHHWERLPRGDAGPRGGVARGRRGVHRGADRRVERAVSD